MAYTTDRSVNSRSMKIHTESHFMSVLKCEIPFMSMFATLKYSLPLLSLVGLGVVVVVSVGDLSQQLKSGFKNPTGQLPDSPHTKSPMH